MNEDPKAASLSVKEVQMFAGWTVAERLYTEAHMLPVNYLPAPQGRRLLLCGLCTVIPATEYSISRANQTITFITLKKEINFSNRLANYTKLKYNPISGFVWV